MVIGLYLAEPKEVRCKQSTNLSNHKITVKMSLALVAFTKVTLIVTRSVRLPKKLGTTVN